MDARRGLRRRHFSGPAARRLSTAQPGSARLPNAGCGRSATYEKSNETGA
jgi:hypothetical protein